jgi:hypothetical protein
MAKSKRGFSPAAFKSMLVPIEPASPPLFFKTIHGPGRTKMS